MNNLKHTPGKWTLTPSGDGKFITLGKGQSSWGTEIGEIHTDDIDRDEAKANARLIAAAPEMLKELVKIYNTMYNTQHESYWMPIKDVIEKATGLSIEEVLK